MTRRAYGDVADNCKMPMQHGVQSCYLGVITSLALRCSYPSVSQWCQGDEVRSQYWVESPPDLLCIDVWHAEDTKAHRSMVHDQHLWLSSESNFRNVSVDNSCWKSKGIAQATGHMNTQIHTFMPGSILSKYACIGEVTKVIHRQTGTASHVLSDIGKKFHAAAKFLSSRLFSSSRSQWIFNVVCTIWWGGMFERLVRSTKLCLWKMIGWPSFTRDKLATYRSSGDWSSN